MCGVCGVCGVWCVHEAEAKHNEKTSQLPLGASACCAQLICNMQSEDLHLSANKERHRKGTAGMWLRLELRHHDQLLLLAALFIRNLETWRL